MARRRASGRSSRPRATASRPASRFAIRRNQLWFIKFDPPGWRAMATGSEIVAAKLFWAAGYHTAEYHIAQLVPSNLVIGKDTRITPPGEAGGAMHQGDIGWLLSRADRDADGSYRVMPARRRRAGRSAASSSRHARRRSERRHPARASPRAARLLRVRRVAESRRREGHQLAVVAGHRERPHASSATTCSISDRRSAARRSGRAKAGKATRRWSKTAGDITRSARCRSASDSRCGGRRIFRRGAVDRPPAARSREVESRRRGGRTSPTRRSATCARTIRSGRRTS